jgi:hypothetical protein
MANPLHTLGRGVSVFVASCRRHIGSQLRPERTAHSHRRPLAHFLPSWHTTGKPYDSYLASPLAKTCCHLLCRHPQVLVDVSARLLKLRGDYCQRVV